MRPASRWLLSSVMPLLALSISACPAAGPDPASEAAAARPGIDATNQQLMDAFAATDREGISAAYTSDAQLLAPGAPSRVGHQAIVQAFVALIEGGFERLNLETVELEARGDTAYEVGRYTLAAGGEVTDAGKYVVIWKRGDDGTWRLHRDIFNSSGPLAPVE